MNNIEQNLRRIDDVCMLLPKPIQDRIENGLLDAMRTFRDPGSPISPRNMTERVLGRYCFYGNLHDFYLQDETVGGLSVIREVYRHGLHIPEADIMLKPGESILSMHLAEGFFREEGGTKKSDRVGLLLARARFSFGSLTHLLQRVEAERPEMMPRHIVAPTYRRLAQAAGYMGLRTACVPRAHSMCVMLSHDAHVRKDESRGELGKPWIAYLRTNEFMEQFPVPEQPYVWSPTFKVRT